MRTVLMVVVVIAAGCKGGDDKAKKEGAGAGSAVLERCVSEVEKGLASGEFAMTGEFKDGKVEWKSDGIGKSLARMGAACRDVFPRCREDVDRLAGGKGMPSEIVKACAHLYCGDLAEPLPALCGNDARGHAASMEALGAMARHEWGAQVDAFAARGRALVEATAPKTPTPGSAPTGGGAGEDVIASRTGPVRSLLLDQKVYWLVEAGGEPVNVEPDRLADELAKLQAARKDAHIELAAEDRVTYQQMITAMDTATLQRMHDIAIVDPGSLTTKLPPAGVKAPKRCKGAQEKPAAPPEAEPAVDIKKMPIVILVRDGSGTFSRGDEPKQTFAAAKGCQATIPALTAWLSKLEPRSSTVVLQADKDLTGADINRVVRAAHAGGAPNVMFAVKRTSGPPP